MSVAATLPRATAAALVFLTAACASQVSGTASKGVATFPSSSPGAASGSSSSPSASSARNALPRSTKGGVKGAALERIAVQPSELPAGLRARLIPGGADVTGEVTLDNCGYNFTTEPYRVARRQYAYTANGAQTSATEFSNELVAYDNAQHAAEALAQWHVAAATCPKTAVKSAVADEPPTQFTVLRNDQNIAGLPVPQNALTIESFTATQPDSTVVNGYSLILLQLKGVYLDILYLNSDQSIAATDVATMTRYATLTGQRLAQSS